MRQINQALSFAESIRAQPAPSASSSSSSSSASSSAHSTDFSLEAILNKARQVVDCEHLVIASRAHANASVSKTSARSTITAKNDKDKKLMARGGGSALSRTVRGGKSEAPQSGRGRTSASSTATSNRTTTATANTSTHTPRTQEMGTKPRSDVKSNTKPIEHTNELVAAHSQHAPIPPMPSCAASSAAQSSSASSSAASSAPPPPQPKPAPLVLSESLRELRKRVAARKKALRTLSSSYSSASSTSATTQSSFTPANAALISKLQFAAQVDEVGGVESACAKDGLPEVYTLSANELNAIRQHGNACLSMIREQAQHTHVNMNTAPSILLHASPDEKMSMSEEEATRATANKLFVFESLRCLLGQLACQAEMEQLMQRHVDAHLLDVLSARDSVVSGRGLVGLMQSWTGNGRSS